MSSHPFFQQKKKDGTEIVLGPSFGRTVVLVALLLVILCLALSGVDWKPLIVLLRGLGVP
jgi:hypothetical protein